MKRQRAVLVAVVFLGTASGCGTPEAARVSQPAQSPTRSPTASQSATESAPTGSRRMRQSCVIPTDYRQRHEYLGLTLAEARQRAGREGLLFRVAAVDGEGLVLQQDYRGDRRVNVETVNGRVVCALMF